MKISILTLFPAMFQGPFDFSIINRAREKGLVEINLVDIRQFGTGKHKIVDDTPYGGGVGMVLKVDIIHKALESVLEKNLSGEKQKIVLLSAAGKTYDQRLAREFSNLEHLVIICGHYEGVDERVLNFVDLEISIGDYVLTGGEIPAMVLTDSVARLVKGVLKPEATTHESFSDKLVEYPQYTRPEEFENLNVPEILLSGDHGKIGEWRRKKANKKTSKLKNR